MRKVLAALLVTSFVVSGCASVRESRINPFNWFGNSRAAPLPDQSGAAVNPLIPTGTGGLLARQGPAPYRGQPVDQITDLRVERIAGGALIHARGIAPRADAHNIRLTADPDAPAGTLAYRLEAEYAASGPDILPRARQVIAAQFLTDQQLDGIRVIRVSSQTNARESRR